MWIYYDCDCNMLLFNRVINFVDGSFEWIFNLNYESFDCVIIIYVLWCELREWNDWCG